MFWAGPITVMTGRARLLLAFRYRIELEALQQPEVLQLAATKSCRTALAGGLAPLLGCSREFWLCVGLNREELVTMTPTLQHGRLDISLCKCDRRVQLRYVRLHPSISPGRGVL